MSVELCPYIEEDGIPDPCPGCGILPDQGKEMDFQGTVKECILSIRDRIEQTIENDKLDRLGKVLLLELSKLKRITSWEEEIRMNVANQARAIGIVAQLEKLSIPFSREDEVAFRLDIGDVLYNSGEYNRALGRFLELSKSDPDNKNVWNNIAVALVRLGRSREALEHYDKALELDPKFGSAWFNKGKAFFTLGMTRKALECFREAVRQSPEHKSAWNNLGVILRQLKRYRESIECYDEAIKIHTMYPWAWHNKGVALMELKRYKEAMQCFERALQIDPDYEPAKKCKMEVMRKVM
jgi:tetratricopeptide (TPR) repeat protein